MPKSTSMAHISGKKQVVMVEIAGKGGICHYTFNLCQRLSGLCEVVLLTGKGYELAGEQRSFRVVEMFNRFRTNPFFLGRFLSVIAQPDVTAVHIQLSQYPVFAALLAVTARLAGKQVVVTAHNVVSHEEKRWEQQVFRLLYTAAARVIVHAQANKDELMSIFPLDERSIRVIPHGNYLFFGGDTVSNTPPGEGYNLLFFGYIRPYKGLIHLIRALKSVIIRVPQARLYIVGKPVEDFSSYKKEIEALGLTKNVVCDLTYVPFDRVRGYFQQANIVVLPYLKVYQSGVLQLAYGFSRPVVVTDTGGMAEAVVEGSSGYIVPPGDEAALAERLARLLTDHPAQLRMGAYARQMAQTVFSWDRIAGQTMAAYGEGSYA